MDILDLIGATSRAIITVAGIFVFWMAVLFLYGLSKGVFFA